MAQWTHVVWPNFPGQGTHPAHYIATEEGWVESTTGEIVVAISNLWSKRRIETEEAIDQYMLEDGNFLLLEETGPMDWDRPLFYILDEI